MYTKSINNIHRVQSGHLAIDSHSVVLPNLRQMLIARVSELLFTLGQQAKNPLMHVMIVKMSIEL